MVWGELTKVFTQWTNRNMLKENTWGYSMFLNISLEGEMTESIPSVSSDLAKLYKEKICPCNIMGCTLKNG